MSNYEERLVPDRYYRDLYPTYANYLGRYAFAARFMSDRATVLDLACGCGYGTAHLAESPGRLVLGLDRSAEAVRYARRQYGTPRLIFVSADATAIPVRSGSLDGVVAMEMIEHVHDDKALVHEIYRTLKPAGVCILSTPNRLVTGTVERPANPFHVREYAPDEFRTLLGLVFGDVTLYGHDLTPASRAYQESMARIWQNLSLIPVLFDQLHALRARVEMDERVTGLSLLRKLKRELFRTFSGAETSADGTMPDINQQFRHAQALINGMTDWDIVPYTVEQAPIIVVVCRK